MLGSGLLTISDIYHQSWFSVGLGFFWISISLCSLLNNNKLSDHSLKLCSCVFSIVFILFLYQPISSILYSFDSLSKDILNIMALLATFGFIVIYSLLTAHKLMLIHYILLVMLFKLIMIPALFDAGNIASLSFQAYSIIIAIAGLLLQKKQKKI